ncbi:MAG TPA: heparinase, partial [Deltaproteobacteria bacterium]|nr:heparinase [Deltaproteobacteria bacterium]
ELLVDPGTYRYNGEPSWRRYFKSTSAHNTVTVDGLDQAVQETGFIWSNPFGCRVLRRAEVEAGYLVEAEHDGYRRLPEPVLHRRALLHAAPGVLVVRDSFSGAGEHDFALHFHLHPDAAVSREDGWWYISRGERRIWLTLLDGCHLELLQGELDPLLGWYAPAYGSKVPAGVLRCRKRGACRSVSFRTVIGWGAAPDNAWLDALGGAL